MNNIILLVGHTRNLALCADSIIKNLCIPNNAKVIGFTYDNMGWWSKEDQEFDPSIKNIWHSALGDYLLKLNIRTITNIDIERYQKRIVKNLILPSPEIPLVRTLQMIETWSLAIQLLPENTDKVILTRPDLYWHENMIYSGSGFDVIGVESFIDGNYFAGNASSIKIFHKLHLQYISFCLRENICCDFHNVLAKYLPNNCDGLNILDGNIARFSIMNSKNGNYRTV